MVHETDETGESNVPCKGHSMLCFIDSDCKSRLRILRLASTHYPSLRSFLHAVYGARNSHLEILKLDEALSKGNFSVLMKTSSVSLDTIFSLVKEYQNRGAPHYHVLLWIRDAPVIGVDHPEKVLTWIQERITCKLPDKESDPDLHALVARYQMHKCSAYCKQKVKRGGVFVTSCRFNFPRKPCETAVLHCVEEKLKKRQKIYELKRSESEVRVNDYNPLLWQANVDIQFVAESSLALSHYITGYVTKAEKSSMQEMWQEIGESSSIYSRLWKFGIQALKSRECGLYEASNLLLGDHLLEKSETVQYVSVEMPHKRRRRLKNHSELKDLAETDPDSEDIFMEDVIGTHYPKRPDNLDDLCLHGFVAKYDWYTKDRRVKRVHQSRGSSTTSCTIHRKNTRGKNTSTLCCFCLCPSGMKPLCSKKARLQRKHSIISCLPMTTALLIMQGCRQC